MDSTKEIHFIGGPYDGVRQIVSRPLSIFKVAKTPGFLNTPAFERTPPSTPITCEVVEYRIRRAGTNPETGRQVFIGMMEDWLR